MTLNLISILTPREWIFSNFGDFLTFPVVPLQMEIYYANNNKIIIINNKIKTKHKHLVQSIIMPTALQNH